jgi:hypothetical protein
MSEIVLREFFNKKKHTAYTWSEIKRRVKVPNLSHKLNQNVRFGYINVIEGLVRLKSKRVMRTKYFYVGNPQKFVPKAIEIF